MSAMRVKYRISPSVLASSSVAMLPRTKIADGNSFTAKDVHLSNRSEEIDLNRGELVCADRHIGQLASLCIELLFLANTVIKVADQKPLLVYVGAAPGNHLVHLLPLLAGFEVHCYDTEPYCSDLVETEDIKLFQKEFTTQLAEETRSSNKGRSIYFISDVRSRSYTGHSLQYADMQVNDELIEADHKNQMEWVRAIQPTASLVKFRVYKTNNIMVRYMAGTLYLKPWTKPHSHELCLVSVGAQVSEDRLWDTPKIKRMMNYHNMIRRMECVYRDDTLDIAIDANRDLSNNWDSYMTKYCCERFASRVKFDRLLDQITEKYRDQLKAVLL